MYNDNDEDFAYGSLVYINLSWCIFQQLTSLIYNTSYSHFDGFLALLRVIMTNCLRYYKCGLFTLIMRWKSGGGATYWNDQYIPPRDACNFLVLIIIRTFEIIFKKPIYTNIFNSTLCILWAFKIDNRSQVTMSTLNKYFMYPKVIPYIKF